MTREQLEALWLEREYNSIMSGNPGDWIWAELNMNLQEISTDELKQRLEENFGWKEGE